MPVAMEQAHRYVQQSLDAYLPGAPLEKGAEVFYGYCTITVLKDGKVFGMLGVRGITAGSGTTIGMASSPR